MSELANLRKKTVVSLLQAWRDITGRADKGELKPGLPDEDVQRLRAQMQLCLNHPGGEVTARAHTVELGHMYLQLNETGHARFLKLLAEEFDVDYKKLAAITQKYTAASSAPERMKLEMEMRQSLTTPRSTILRQFTALPDGFQFLVNMRADLVPLVGKDPKLQGLEFDLKTILSTWFDVGLLDLVEITWNSPAALLEKITEYEAVHKIVSWDDLKNRLDADRRVFAFFHNKMPMEPLIFVHVALVQGMSDNVQKLLDEKSPLSHEKADTAIFYSISNAQKGLAGISFGNFLIKRVVAELTKTMPKIETFATLSPVPGFRAWLDPLVASGNSDLFDKDDLVLLKQLDTDWYKDAKLSEKMKPLLLHLCAHYLINEKKGGKPLDPVAAFHLFNGSELARINWLGDTSPKGMKQSAGLMVNYHYNLSKIDENHEAFVSDAKVVAGKQVKSYLK